MPPRLNALPRLGTTSLCLRQNAKPTTPNLLPVMQTASLTQKEKKRLAKQDPYRWQQTQQRKNANLERRGELQRERDASMGDPILGRTTPFLESLDSAGQAKMSKVATDGDGNPIGEAHPLPTTEGMRNYFLNDSELKSVVARGQALTKPIVGVLEPQINVTGPEDSDETHAAKHAKALEALQRITGMGNSSAKDRHHANVRRIINEFGRHKTDRDLKPKPESIHPNTTEMPGRSGPDTGSSEVQIAILTAKIRALANALKINRGYKDKHNQRNLRLLAHRRQKLLRYMERKERGSERWTHMLEKLGLTPATWKQQITV